MLEVPEIGVEAHVFVGLVVTVEVADNRQIGRIGHPQVAAPPRQSLDGIEAGGEDLGAVGLAVAVGVQHPDHAVAGGLGRRVAVLRPHPHAEAAPQIEGHRARLADQRFPGEARDLEPGRHGGQRFAIGGGVFEIGSHGRQRHRQQGAGKGQRGMAREPVSTPVGAFGSGSMGDHGVELREMGGAARSRPEVSGAQRMATMPRR